MPLGSGATPFLAFPQRRLQGIERRRPYPAGPGFLGGSRHDRFATVKRMWFGVVGAGGHTVQRGDLPYGCRGGGKIGMPGGERGRLLRFAP